MGLSTDPATPAQQEALSQVSDLALVMEIARRHGSTAAAIDTLEQPAFNDLILNCRQTMDANGMPTSACELDAFSLVLMMSRGFELVRAQVAHLVVGDSTPDPSEAIYWLTEVLGRRNGQSSAFEAALAALDPYNLPRTPPTPEDFIHFRDVTVPALVEAAQAVKDFSDLIGR